jgi:DNA-binding transcriptional ArsR family regulator
VVRYADELSRTFSALSDPTRRAVLERLVEGPATVSELATSHEVSVPGMLKHLRVLQDARLLRTAKRGRVRSCGLTPRPMRRASRYIDRYRALWEKRFDALEAHLRRMKESES